MILVEVYYLFEEVKVEGEFVGEFGIIIGVIWGDVLDFFLMWCVFFKLRDMEGGWVNGFFVMVDNRLIFFMLICKFFGLCIFYYYFWYIIV